MSAHRINLRMVIAALTRGSWPTGTAAIGAPWRPALPTAGAVARRRRPDRR
jgi:hypothetical protein